MNLKQYFTQQQTRVDEWLDELLPNGSGQQKNLHNAIRYSVFSGGKRIRPILALACSEAIGGRTPASLKFAASSLEMVHAYSLIHDDLPCMDDDDFRRGKKTTHNKYNEFTAVLAGDSLLTFAFEVLSRIRPAEKAIAATKELSMAIGTEGMIGGQQVDKEYEEKKKTLAVMDYINIQKTGKLITASCRTGAIMANATPPELKKITRYGECLGLVFQLIDDVIDGDGYVGFKGEAACIARAEELTKEAKVKIKSFKNSETLERIADFVLERRK